ncbi:hypothetical protein DTL42_07120 [Bremerella cremea]|uniref:Uncharacterized protein n=1 Tax=Bremerella cremea TaxID=1031537 RepID=A0A368KYG2_9BACT|nr:hypothetical protein DTL42_07120 [Bremerella cremea]
MALRTLGFIDEFAGPKIWDFSSHIFLPTHVAGEEFTCLPSSAADKNDKFKQGCEGKNTVRKCVRFVMLTAIHGKP